MKKLVAKFMAAAMLLSAVPAITLPSIEAQATKAIRFDYTTAFCSDFEPNGSNRVALRQTVRFTPAEGMTMMNERTWDTGVVLYGSNDELYDPYSEPAVTTAPSSNNYVGAETLNPASYTMASAQDSDREIDGDYYDPNGFVKKLTTNGSGHVIVTFKEEFTDSQKRLIREGSGNYFDLYVWPCDEAYDHGTYFVRFQVGEYYRAENTKIKNACTSDGFIKNAEVTIDEQGDATIHSVDKNDLKTTMKKEAIDISEIFVSGVPYPVAVIEEQAFKSGKMKEITAENLVKIETGAFRKCTNLTKVKMQESPMERIKNKAFFECSSLKLIKFNGEEIKTIGKKAFYGLKKNCKINIKGTKSEYKEVLTKIRKSGTSGVKCYRIDDDDDEDEDDD